MIKTNTELCMVSNSLPAPLKAAQCTLVNSMMYKSPVLRIKAAHVSDSKELETAPLPSCHYHFLILRPVLISPDAE